MAPPQKRGAPVGTAFAAGAGPAPIHAVIQTAIETVTESVRAVRCDMRGFLRTASIG